MDLTGRGVDITSPQGTLRYPYLQRPCTKVGETEIKPCFKTKLVITPDVAKEFIPKLEELYKLNVKLQTPLAKGKPVKEGHKPWGPEIDNDGNPTGNVVLNCKSNAKRGDFDFRPKIFNKDGTPFTSQQAIGGGTTAQLALRVRGWLVKGEAGLSLGIEAANIKSLVVAGKQSAEDYGFTKEETPKDEY